MNELTIFNYFKAKGLSDYGVAGLMGNLYAESALNPKNLQNSFEKSLGMSDDAYVAAVDNGTYTDFVRDKAGFGLAQWTYWSRKQALLNFAKAAGKSIGDLTMQLDFLWKELSESYPGVLAVLRSAASVREASDAVLLQFERPADMGAAVQVKRAGYAQTYYDKYATIGKEENMEYTNSPLVSYTKLSPNKNSPRTHAIDTITIHCIVGQWTAKQGCDYFASSSVQASANYIVGKDGSVGLCVEEGDRSWCSSNAANDHRAITIEVASDATSPYAVTDAAYNALIGLVADICKRNGIRKLLWKGDKSLIGQVDKRNMTVHRWFANKACPGDYLYNRHGAIAEAVNKKLEGGSDGTAPMDAVGTVTASSLNIRSGPGTSYNVIGGLSEGDTVTITGSCNSWYKIRYGSADNAWVSAKYIAINTNSTEEQEEDDMTCYKTLDDVPSYYRDAVQKVVNKGALNGTGNNELNVSEDLCRVLTILDRLGKLD